jgi:integrase
MLNWAVDEGCLSRSPVSSIKTPKRKRREIIYTPDQWKLIQEKATGSLVDFLNFLWLTGCRPKEARIVTANCVRDDLVIFPPDESKGETDARVVYLIVSQLTGVGMDERRHQVSADPDQQKSVLPSHRVRSKAFICHERAHSCG